jgi:hypothetical protein
MQAPISSEEYRRLELIPRSDSGPALAPNSALTLASNQNWLSRWWNAVLAYFNDGSELRIWRAIHDDQLVWRVYDPVTRRRTEFTSELDLRIWLEKRYYQPACGLLD